jgi:transposase
LLRQQGLGPIPEDTARAVRAVFPKGHAYIKFVSVFEELYEYYDFSELYPTLGQSAEHPGRLALVSMLQFAEGLSDREAADAVRRDLLWKYLLRLPIDDSGFDSTVLSEFRNRLVTNGQEQLLFDKLLSLAQEKGLLKKSKQRTDSTFVFARAKNLSRLELVQETMRNTLEVLAVAAPEWLQQILKPEWFERYEQWGYNYRLAKTETKRKQLIQDIGEDGFYLLSAIDRDMLGLKDIEAVATLRRVWEEQFTNNDGGPPKFREVKDLAPSAERIASPHDTDARFGMKRTTKCMGYKVHLSETFEEGAPHLITNVETTPATTPDAVILPVVHQSLCGRDMKPDEHLVDAGYTNAETMLSSRNQQGIDVIGPLTGGSSWQARDKKGFDVSYFTIDFESKIAVCPQGVKNATWRERKSRKTVEILFPKEDCLTCPFQTDCTKSKDGVRQLEIKRQTAFEFVQQQWQRERTDEFKQKYAKRSGIEGTQSQAANKGGMRRARYFGLEKVTLQNFIGATAINFRRIASFLDGAPVARTRQTRFQRLKAA